MSSSPSPPPHSLLLFSPSTGLPLSSLSTPSSPPVPPIPNSHAGSYCNLLRLAESLPGPTGMGSTASVTVRLEVLSPGGEDVVSITRHDDQGVVVRQKEAAENVGA
ncbi:hypothetical protein TeGR_g12946 [Tetraparma gracilis]|uniref:Uncharacterized protein n=1 Tax=Tetraparma gracilis TaxID=2962635 RepID=A0ABQ6MJ16_9STRA|nr:hypothetical protein TeGR_g12946 [Tetraparma gracilis]